VQAFDLSPLAPAAAAAAARSLLLLLAADALSLLFTHSHLGKYNIEWE
jgi:hypothetical protein